MTDRLEDVQRHQQVVNDIGDVVGALRAIASGHMHEARTALDAITRYEAQIIAAVSRVGGTVNPMTGPGTTIVIGASQGFCGGYPARVAQAARDTVDGGLIVIGKRTIQMMADAGRAPDWSADLPAAARFVPSLASAVTDQCLNLSLSRPGPIRVLSGRNETGLPIRLRQIWPLDLPDSAGPASCLTTIPAESLIVDLLGEVLFVQVARAICEGLYIENRARNEAMSRAQNNLKSRRAEIEQRLRQVRQDAMTTEVIELASTRPKTEQVNA